MELASSDSLAVIVYGPMEGACRDLAEAWTQAGLLAPSVWVSAVQDGLDRVGAPTINADLVGVEGSTSHDLFTVIGVRRLRRVRLIALQVVHADSDATPEVLRTSGLIADALRHVLPTDEPHGEGGTTLNRINLIVPETNARPIGLTHIQAGWEVNAVASPEDRPDLDRASIFVRNGMNQSAHATAATASVGGLWPGINAGIFDSHRVDSSSSVTDLVVFRASARILQGNEAAQELANLALDAVRPQDSTPDVNVSTGWGTPARSPEDLVNVAVRELRSTGEWARDLTQEVEVPRKTELSFKTAIGEFLRFQIKLLASGISVVRNGATRIAEHAVTGALVGHRGDAVVRAAPQSPNDLLAAAKQALDTQARQLRGEYLEREIARSTPPVAETWTDLRKLCFGLVDGGELPAGFSTPERGGTREFVQPAAIVPHPHEFFDAPGKPRIPPIDVRSASLLKAELSEAIAEDEGAEEHDAVEAASDLDVSTEVDDVEADVESAHGSDDIVDEALVAPAGETQGAESARALLQRLERWESERKDSLLWKVMEQILGREKRAEEAARSSAKRAMTDTLPEPTDVLSARTVLIVIWAVVALFWIVAGLWSLLTYSAAYGWDPRGLDPVRSTAFVLTIALIGLAACFFGGWRYYRAVSRYAWEVRNALAQRKHAAELFVAASRERDRLANFESSLLEWATAIGWFVHAPWLTPQPDNFGVGVDPEQLPASVAVAQTDSSEGSLPKHIIDACVREICAPGWTSSIFSQAQQSLLDGLGPDRTEADEHALRQPGAIAAFAALDDTRTMVAKRLGAKVRDLIAERRLVIPPRVVTRLGRYAPPDQMEDDDFFAGALGPQTPFVKDIWSDSGQVAGRHTVAHSEIWLPQTRKTASVRLRNANIHRSNADVSLRVDFSVECQPTDIKLIAGSDASAPSSTPVDDGLSWN